MAIKILHAADWQIGKQFGFITQDAGAGVRTQRLKTMENIAKLAMERRVDVVVVAGDVFENNTLSDETLRRTLQAMRHFKDGKWILLPGNHDPAAAESAWTRLERIGIPDNIVAATSEEPIFIPGKNLVVLPAPLHRKQEVIDLTESFGSMETPNGVIRVGLAHGSVQNILPGEWDAKNPIAPDRAALAKLDYLALGDWHGTFRVNDRTWYAGTPEPDSFKENDTGNVLLVTLDAPGALPHVEKISVGHFFWHRIEISLHGTGAISHLTREFTALPEPSDRQIVQLRLSGVLDLASRGDLDELLAEWVAKFHYLSVSDENLLTEPTEDDFDRIDLSGFVRTAVERLRTIQKDSTHPERAYAEDALRRIYFEHVSGEGKQ
ncbi:MAG: metallophosphoesterase [Acidobacteriia bacterium]|nr:metallophosphoesterase [Terriglobia bacterium]